VILQIAHRVSAKHIFRHFPYFHSLNHCGIGSDGAHYNRFQDLAISIDATL
jgi:hypothetical protein